MLWQSRLRQRNLPDSGNLYDRDADNLYDRDADNLYDGDADNLYVDEHNLYVDEHNFDDDVSMPTGWGLLRHLR